MMDNYATLFPALKGKKLELAGFVWFQGWNDQYGAQDEYESNMKHFINDVRKDLKSPKLPFVIGVMGQNGSKPATGAMLTIQKAQLAMNDVPEFKGNVKAIRTDVLVDKAAEELYPTWQKNVEQWKLVGGDHRLPLPRQRHLVQPHRQGNGRGDAGTPEELTWHAESSRTPRSRSTPSREADYRARWSVQSTAKQSITGLSGSRATSRSRSCLATGAVRQPFHATLGQTAPDRPCAAAGASLRLGALHKTG